MSGPTSPLAFGEAVLGAIGRSAPSLQNKEQLLRMWSVVVSPLTDTITQVGSRESVASLMGVRKMTEVVFSGRVRQHIVEVDRFIATCLTDLQCKLM